VKIFTTFYLFISIAGLLIIFNEKKLLERLN